MSATLQHLLLAEEGKRAALSGDHRTALGRYRDAMRLAVESKAPEVFFRHYLEATLESLELMEAYENVLEYCDRAIQHYAAHPPAHAVATLDLASIHQRRAMVLLKTNQPERAVKDLDTALELAKSIGARLALAEVVRGWLRRPCAIPKHRLLAEQRRHHYFSVRPETVRAHRPSAPIP